MSDDEKAKYDSLRPPVQTYEPGVHYELGARVAHPEFGTGSVTSVGETWIVVDFDGVGEKRLDQKP
jgi:hypothetical protein